VVHALHEPAETPKIPVRSVDEGVRMSDPWLKVYAADMRGDPEMGILGLAGQMLLVHAWDIARDATTNYGELRMANGRPYTPETLAHVIPGATARLVRAWWSKITEDHDYAQILDDGALFFPTLERHQRGTSNAVRQARHRNASRNAERNGPRKRKVTVEARSQNQRDTDLVRSVSQQAVEPRPRNEQWDGLEAVFSYSASGKEAPLWGKLTIELRDLGATKPSIEEAARRYRLDMPTVTLTPSALVKHYQRLMATPIARANGRQSPAEATLELAREARMKEHHAGQ
jgi:hypothetical protein